MPTPHAQFLDCTFNRSELEANMLVDRLCESKTNSFLHLGVSLVVAREAEQAHTHALVCHASTKHHWSNLALAQHRNILHAAP